MHGSVDPGQRDDAVDGFLARSRKIRSHGPMDLPQFSSDGLRWEGRDYCLICRYMHMIIIGVCFLCS